MSNEFRELKLALLFAACHKGFEDSAYMDDLMDGNLNLIEVAFEEAEREAKYSEYGDLSEEVARVKEFYNRTEEYSPYHLVRTAQEIGSDEDVWDLYIDDFWGLDKNENYDLSKVFEIKGDKFYLKDKWKSLK